MTGHAAQAIDSLRRAIAGFETLTTADPRDTESAFHLADSYNALGDGLGSGSITNSLGDPKGALENYQKALAIYERLVAAYPTSGHFQGGVAVGNAKIAEMHAARGDSTAALESYGRARVAYETLSRAEPNNAQYRAHIARSLVRLVDLLSRGSDRSDSQSLIARRVAPQKSLADRPEASSDELGDYVSIVESCNPGHPCNAAAALPYAKRIVDKSRKQDPESLETLALTYLQAGDPADAVATEQKAVALVAPAARAPYQANLVKYQNALKHRSAPR